MATHSSILVWKIPWTEKPGGLYSPWGPEELDTIKRQSTLIQELYKCLLKEGRVMHGHE